MNAYKIKSYAKINLALNVTGKLTKLHKIESIVAFVDLHDLITLKQTKNSKHIIRFTGKFSKDIKKKNTVQKLFDILDKQKLLINKKFQIRITKNIPQEAGLGGGSMNAASILNFLINKKFIKLNKKKIFEISSLIGSDVILGINPTNTILKSNNTLKKFFNCQRLYTLLVKPNFGCSTKEIYLEVNKFTKSKFNKPKKKMFDPNFLINQNNSLERIAFSKYPKLKTIKSFLETLKPLLFVRMTGSGSTIIGYFKSKQDCELAKVQFKRKFKDYWCNTSKTI